MALTGRKRKPKVYSQTLLDMMKDNIPPGLSARQREAFHDVQILLNIAASGKLPIGPREAKLLIMPRLRENARILQEEFLEKQGRARNKGRKAQYGLLVLALDLFLEHCELTRIAQATPPNPNGLGIEEICSSCQQNIELRYRKVLSHAEKDEPLRLYIPNTSKKFRSHLVKRAASIALKEGAFPNRNAFAKYAAPIVRLTTRRVLTLTKDIAQ